MAKGGTRIGGKPKGYKAPATLTKELIRARIQARVAAELDPLLDAQIAATTGTIREHQMIAADRRRHADRARVVDRIYDVVNRLCKTQIDDTTGDAPIGDFDLSASDARAAVELA